MMVSERHNQAYRETIKLFEPLAPDAPLHRHPVDSHVPGPDGGHLVHTSAEPLFSAAECQWIVEESEDWASRAGGWTSKRHFNHPTTDIPLAELPLTRRFLNEIALPERIYPLLGHAFEGQLPNWRKLRVADAFVVKYDAAKGQTFLAKHRDGSVVSFNVALNSRGEYEGGGTLAAASASAASCSSLPRLSPRSPNAPKSAEKPSPNRAMPPLPTPSLGVAPVAAPAQPPSGLCSNKSPPPASAVVSAAVAAGNGGDAMAPSTTSRVLPRLVHRAGIALASLS